MNLDEGMGRDAPRYVAPKRAAPRPRRFPAVAWVVVAVVVLCAGFFVVVTLVAGQGAQPAPASPARVVTPEATPEEHEEPEAGASRAAWTTLNTFFNGWTSTSVDSRNRVFDQTVIPELAEGFKDTSPDKVVQANLTSVKVTAATAYSTTFEVRLEGIPSPVWVILTSGHSDGSTSSYDWRVAELQTQKR